MLKLVSDRCQNFYIFASFKHSHKKQKDSLETGAVRLICLLELEISRVAVQSIHQNSEKWQLLRNYLVKMTLRLF